MTYNCSCRLTRFLTPRQPHQKRHAAHCLVPVPNRKSLVELATNNDEPAAYLDKLSHNLTAMVDLALIVKDTVLPAHSYVVAASCPVLGELLCARLAERASLDHVDTSDVLSLDL